MSNSIALRTLKAPQFPKNLNVILQLIELARSSVDKLELNDYTLFYTNFETIRPSLKNLLLEAYYNEEMVNQELDMLAKKNYIDVGMGVVKQDLEIYEACVKSVLKNSYVFMLLHHQYPGFILAPKHAEFTKNYVGGVYAEIRIVYASLTSYIALYSTCLTQSGFSGVYPEMTVHDLMISGTMHGSSYGPQSNLPVTYVPGGYSKLEPGNKWTYQMVTENHETELYEPVSMLDIGYGDIPDAFWEGIIMPAIKDSDYRSALIQLRDDIRATEKSCCIIL